jgi:hypothetical protein
MKRRFLYYSLVAAMTASAVTFSSCDKDDDNSPNETTTTTTTTPEESPKEVEKFAVNVNLNGESILSQQVEVGKKISINLDELTKNPLTQEALKGYEILSITKDGKEVSGEVEISAESKFEINAIKYATLEYQLPKEGEILHSSKVSQIEEGRKRIKKDAPIINFEPLPGQLIAIPTTSKISDTWIQSTSDNKLYILTRSTRKSENKINYNYAYENFVSYEQTTGKIYISESGLRSKYAAPIENEKEYLGYFFKIGDKYYEADLDRYTKSETVKGFKTTWTSENSDDEDPVNITITDEKFDEYSYDYKNGIITVKVSADNEHKFIYDGTYLYIINKEADKITDFITFNEGKLWSIEKAQVPENIANSFEQINGTDGTYVYRPKGADAYIQYGFYDWNKDNEIEIPATDGGNDEFMNTIVGKYENYPFGQYFYFGSQLYIFPDGKICLNNYYGDIKDNSVFTDGNYVVINANAYIVVDDGRN